MKVQKQGNKELKKIRNVDDFYGKLNSQQSTVTVFHCFALHIVPIDKGLHEDFIRQDDNHGKIPLAVKWPKHIG